MSKPVLGPSPSTPPHTPPTPLSPSPSPTRTQRPSTTVFNQSTHLVHLSTSPQSADMSTIHSPAPTLEEPPSITKKAPASKLPLSSSQLNGSAQKLATAASVSKQASSSSSSSSSSSVSPASIPSPTPPNRLASSSAPRAHRPQQSSPRPSGVPVMEPPALQPSSSSKTRQSPATLPLKPHSNASKPTTRGPHTPPEQSPSRPGGSPPSLYVFTKHHPTKPANTMNNTDLPKHGQQQQQQHEESQAGEWTRQTARRRKAQHGKRVKPANTQATKPAQIQNATQAPRAKPSFSNNMSQHHVRDIQRQAVRTTTDLPLKAASLNEAADRNTDSIKAAIGQPISYSGAVGPASFWADVVTPLVGDKVPISFLLKKYRGTDKHAQLIKLTKGSRPFTQYRSIRGVSAHCIAMPCVVSVLSGLSMLLICYCILPVCTAHFGDCLHSATFWSPHGTNSSFATKSA